MNLIVGSLLLLISCHQVQPFIVTLISTIYDLYQVVNDAHDTYSKVVTPNTQDLMDEILSVKDSVNQVTKEVSHKIDELYTQLITALPRIGQVNRGLESFSRLFNRISYLYKNFERLIRRKKPTTRTLREFASVALSYYSDSVSATLDALHELFVPTEVGHINDGLLLLIAENLQVTAKTKLGCSKGSPPEEQLYLMYTALLTAEIRGFMMQAFTYVILENISGESYANEIQDSRLQALVRINEYMAEISNIIDWSSKVYYACDPPEGYERNVSVAELDMFMSTYIALQWTILHDCRGYCDDAEDIWKAAEIEKCDESDNVCSHAAPCTGRVYQCKNLVEGSGQLCTNPAEDIGSKRYIYVRAGGNLWGNNSRCNWKIRHDFNSKTMYHSRTGTSHRCDYCICTCLEDTPTSKHRYVVSFIPQIADFAKNKVVAGIRFVKTGHVLHLQIQQGEVQFDGIAANTLEWLPLPTIELYEQSYRREKMLLARNEKGEKYTDTRDYSLIDYYGKDFNFDDIAVPDGYVVTGAKLKSAQYRNIEVEVHATPYDFANSKVIISDEKPSIWVKSSSMSDRFPEYKQAREEIEQVESTSVVDYTKRTVLVSKPNTWLRTGFSNLKGDVGGTVNPLIDIRDVATPSLSMLEGIGTIYKRPEDSDVGYIAFSLRAVSRKKFLETEVTADELKVD